MRISQSGAVATLAASFVLFAGCASTPTPVATTSTPATAVSPGNANLNKPATASTANPGQSVSGNAIKPVGDKVYFDYDKFDVKEQYTAVVRGNADYLAKAGGVVELDGNADERGSREYNMALGQKRADAVKRAMTALGANAARIETISFGEDKPKATGHNEAAWAENRRVDVVLKSK